MRTPPDALTPISGPTVSRIRATSYTVAPPGPKPVEVLTKSALAFLAKEEAITFSSSVNSAVSSMTLQSAPPSWAASTTLSMSVSTSP